MRLSDGWSDFSRLAVQPSIGKDLSLPQVRFKLEAFHFGRRNDTAGDFDDADVLLKTYHSATVGISSEWFIAKGVSFVVSRSQIAPTIYKNKCMLRLVFFIFGLGILPWWISFL